MDIKIIGIGGIGCVLSDLLCQYINYLDYKEKFNITFVDGDVYKEENKTRQTFQFIGNKARVKREQFRVKYKNINFDAVDSYLNNTNIHIILKENDLVFLCVDNHVARNRVSTYIEEVMSNCILVSGGNDYYDGNVQIFIKKNGVKITPSLTEYHDEIKNPDDKSPDEMGCEELSKSEPQLLFTNSTAAIIMCWYFYDIITEGAVFKGFDQEAFFDIKSKNVRTVRTR